MRFRELVLAYFVIGAVMFGGGAIAWESSGVATWFISNDQTGLSVEEKPQTDIENSGSTITSVIQDFGGPAILVWNLAAGTFAFLHWPIVVLATNNAPPTLTILLGGGLVVGFYMSLVGLVKSSA